MKKTGRHTGAVMAVLFVLSVPASAQAPPPLNKPTDLDRRVFVDVNQVPPVEVLRELAPVIATRLEPAANLPETPVSLRLWNVRARTALDALCDMVGCRWQVDGRTLRVTAGPPPPPIPRSAEFFAQLKKPLEGDQWNFVRASLRDVVAALSKAVGQSVVFEDVNLDLPVTVDLRGVTPYRAMFNVMVAIGWDTRQVGWSGDFNPGGPIVLKGSGWKGFETNPPPRTPADKIYEKGEPGLTMPRVISDAKPRYTREAMRARIEGSVTLSAVVEVDGTVGEVKVLASLHPDLDQQAILAARNWRFEPGRKDGKPVPVQVTLDMTFTLK